MTAWSELPPELADAGRGLLYQVGVGLAFLATVARDGAPRTHPVCPLLTETDVYAFLVPSPKRDDLLRDGRYAMHSFPTADNEDAFYLAGRAAQAEEHRDALVQQFVDERKQLSFTPDELADQLLFRFDIERVLLTRTTGYGDRHPQHTVWHAP